MPPKREVADNAIYHIVQRGNNKQVIFRDENDYRQFLYSLSKCSYKYPFELYHYCLMPNHIHLLIRIPKKEDASRLMQALLQSFRFYYQKKYGYVGYLFQGRYRSKLIGQNSYLLECARYIERNPVRSGLVDNPEHYRWSSCRSYFTGRPTGLLTENPLFRDLGPDDVSRRNAFAVYILTQRPYDEILDKVL